jgi:hypothetical protein
MKIIKPDFSEETIGNDWLKSFIKTARLAKHRCVWNSNRHSGLC